MKLNEMIVLADNDGTIRDTNNVKDKCLDVFVLSNLDNLCPSYYLPNCIDKCTADLWLKSS